MSRLLFIHIPKTGGITIRYIINSILNDRILTISPTHATYNDINLNNTIPFCFVRHPVYWFHSVWSYMTKKYRQERGKRYNNIKYLKEWESLAKEMYQILDFNSFDNSVNNLVTKHKGFIGRYFDTYTNGCRYIGKTESLYEDFVYIVDSFNSKILNNQSKQRIMNSKRKNVNKDKSQKLTNEQFEKIYNTEYYIIEKYNYGI